MVDKPIKQICYADDITGWASGVKIPELEYKVNTYLIEMSGLLRLLFIPDPAQANTHPKIKIDNSELPPRPQSNVTMSVFRYLFSFDTHRVRVAN